METNGPDNKSSKRSLAKRLWHAALTPEQRAAWRKKVSRGTSSGMNLWHAGRTEEQREHFRRLQTDAAVCRMWATHQPGVKFKKGHVPMGHSSEAVARRSMTLLIKASVKQIIRALAVKRPELFEDAFIEGLQAPPPRSFPYLALAAAYLDGKPVQADPPIVPIADLSGLTRAELFERAIAVATHLQNGTTRPPTPLQVIDLVRTSPSAGSEEI